MNTSLRKAALLALALVAVSLVGWELYNRAQGFDTSFDDFGALWADKRKQVYGSKDEKTIFIGSSRIKYDLDMQLWKELTGTEAIQLSCVGSSPLPVLKHLADDKKFNGRLVLDITEVLFFSDGPSVYETPDKNISYYKDETPAQKASFAINRFLESKLVFLDKDRLSLNAKLAKLQIPNRPGVFEFPLFPDGFGRSHFNRQEYMTRQFLADTNQQNQTRGVWAFLTELGKKQPPTSGGKLDTLLAGVKADINKIRARGGDVFMVRTPSSGPFLMGENMAYPREKYYNRMLKETGCPGFHFTDSPVTKDMQCPEFSHLSMDDALIYTRELVKQMTQQGWQFPKLNAAAN